MQLSAVICLLIVTVLLVLVLHVEESESLYPYTIRGFVTDVRLHPYRFIGGLFFKKAFILKKLKLKWKLKKKFVLKKLLKKLFFGPKANVQQKAKHFSKQEVLALAQQHGYRGPYLIGSWGGTRGIHPQFQFYQRHPHYIFIKNIHHHRHFFPAPHRAAALAGGNGRKRRAVRFPDDNGNRQGSSLFNNQGTNVAQYDHHPGSSSSSSRMIFDEESYSEFQNIGLGQQELEMLRRLPENLQYEYQQEMQDLETSASEPREADIMEYLSATNEFDTDHCIAKGICEVMARGNTTSNQFEKLLLDYYNEEPETRKDAKGSPAYVYDYAAFLGKSSRNARACASHFPKCPEQTPQLTSFMNEIFSSEVCDPPTLPVRNEL